MQIRNIAIIAHVDHGKTTLTDAMMRETGAIKEGVSMDSNALELERGITIYSKNASVFYPSAGSGRAVTKINIVDTPGHADFGSEVERVLRSIDCVLLVVDAQEGPMPQTRFVLKKSLELGLKPIVVINKIDKPAADPARVADQVLDLFIELGASDEQAHFPVVYAIGREGIAKKSLSEESSDLKPLFETILERVPAASSESLNLKPLRFQPFNLAYDNFLGRLGIGRIYEGTIHPGDQVFLKRGDGARRLEAPGARAGKIAKVFSFNGLERTETNEAVAGDVVVIAGISDIDIGETVTNCREAEPLPAISVDDPTITLNFLINNSPFAGREGKSVTSRQIREYLERECEVNVGLKVDFSDNDSFKVYGRGELHIAILLENMRRAGYELQVSEPQVVTREENGKILEPFEEVIIEAPEIYQGAIIDKLAQRGFILVNLGKSSPTSSTVRLTLEGPTRGILGYRNQFIIDTKGEGIFASRVVGFRAFTGEIKKRVVGSMVSMMQGKALGFALWNLQNRGVLYIGPGTEVYKGMVIGNTSKGETMEVNPTKGKQLTNMRASGSDEAIDLVPPLLLTIERGLEIMAEDEYLEITPGSVRIRKQ